MLKDTSLREVSLSCEKLDAEILGNLWKEHWKEHAVWNVHGDDLCLKVEPH